MRVEPFVRPDESERSVALRDAATRSLDQLMRLTLEKGGSQTPFAWLLEVRSALSELRYRLSDRDDRGAEPNGVGTDIPRRPDLAAQVDQFIEERSLHLNGLDRLLADVNQAAANAVPDSVAMRKRVVAWLDRQQQLSALGPDLMFRVYWDDLGGEG